MWKDERLLATYKDGRAHLNAYLDDYAFLLAALVQVLQAEFDSGTLAFAEEIAEVLLEQFEDRERGGFFFTSHDHERLIHRPKPGYDNATPSGNGIAAYALQRLHYLTGESRYAAAAERTLQQFFGAMTAQPGGHSSLLMALEEHLAPTRTVILRGPGGAAGLAPRTGPALFAAHHGGRDRRPGARCAASAHKPLRHTAGGVNAWVCEGVSCLAPIDRLEDVLAQVSKPVEIQ